MRHYTGSDNRGERNTEDFPTKHRGQAVHSKWTMPYKVAQVSHSWTDPNCPCLKCKHFRREKEKKERRKRGKLSR